MAVKKKYTPMQLAYKKEQERIKRYIKRKEKEGYVVDFEVPPMPSRVTKNRLQEIKDIKPITILKKSWYVTVWGEAVKATDKPAVKKAKIEDKAEIAQRAATGGGKAPSATPAIPDATQAIIAQLRQDFTKLHSKTLTRMFNDWLDKLINAYGETYVAMSIVSSPDLITYLNSLTYYDDLYEWRGIIEAHLREFDRDEKLKEFAENIMQRVQETLSEEDIRDYETASKDVR